MRGQRKQTRKQQKVAATVRLSDCVQAYRGRQTEIENLAMSVRHAAACGVDVGAIVRPSELAAVRDYLSG